MIKNKDNFDFGANWWSYIKGSIKPERINQAVNSLKKFMNVDDLHGKTFVDIGCGTGLFSYAAYLLGAKEILSFDVNPMCVKCCNFFFNKAGKPNNWKIIHASVLDDDVLKKFGKFDVVYSWGVLHHTGNMWKALENVGKMVKSDGKLFIAIYNRFDGGLSSDKWKRIKIFYNNLPVVFKKIMDYSFVSLTFISLLFQGKNPYEKMFNRARGMSYLVDVRDWLGGYPYEYASVREIFQFYKNKFGFILDNVKDVNSIGNNEFLFINPN